MGIDGERSAARERGRVVALTEELAAQLGRMKGGGPKITQFLSMVSLAPPGEDRSAPGARPAGVSALPFDRVRRVIEKDLGARVGRLFDDIDEAPLALASLGQVHRARTPDGDDVAVKVQHAGVAEAVEADLRNLGIVAPIVGRLAPGIDAGAVIAELRERISDELDYEIEAQNQRRIERMFRGHPHVRVPRVHTELSTRRVLVSEYLDGARGDEITRLGDAERDRVGEIAFRFFCGLARRDGIVAGDPQLDNCILGPDARLCLLDFGLLRDLDHGYVQGERAIMRALDDGDPQSVHEGLANLGYLPEPGLDPAELHAFLTTAGGWMFAPGFLRLDPERVAEIVEEGYPPRSSHFGLMRRLRMPAQALLLRRMEFQLLALLGQLRAGAQWAAIAAEHHSDQSPCTELGREDQAFHARRNTRASR
jgi:predicted unusual protein kinase regulating ubiquinone biosynthesis (AarF/ABC1/UbiB family)